jgi:hypothetical protein
MRSRKQQQTFVPSTVDSLEDRAVPTPAFFNGVAVLTPQVYTRAVENIEISFNRFGGNLNYNQLYSNLIKSIGPIPYHAVDGLNNAVLQDVVQLGANIANRVPFSVIGAEQNLLNALRNDMFTRINNGTVILR